MASTAVLCDQTPRYFVSREKAFQYHYENPGYLWKRRAGQSVVHKPFAAGVLPVSRLEIYELFMVNGEKPTNRQTNEAAEMCRETKRLEDMFL